MWVWFMPIIPPIKAFNEATRKISWVMYGFIIKSENINGANFCHVDSNIHETHEIEVITEGYQKWRGAAPSFSIIDAKSRIIMIFMFAEYHIDRLDIKRILEPRLCARKYFTVASVSWDVLLLFIMGINLNRLISIAIHRNNQLVLDRAITALKKREAIDRMIKGFLI